MVIENPHMLVTLLNGTTIEKTNITWQDNHAQLNHNKDTWPFTDSAHHLNQNQNNDTTWPLQMSNVSNSTWPLPDNLHNLSTNATLDHDVWLHDVIYGIRMCFLPIIFVGTVTNILNFLVLSKREMRCLSTSVYLSALAVADLGVMYVELFRVWFEWMDLVPPELYFTDAYCKVVNYTTGIVRDFSNWLIACLAMERVVMVASPYSAKRLCTVKTAKTITLCLLGVLCLPHTVYLVFSTAQYRTHWVCWEDPGIPIGSLLFAIVEFFIGYTVVLVVFILNILLVILLYKNKIPCIGMETVLSSQMQTHSAFKSKRANNNRRLTRTLLFVAMVFIVCETPRIIMSIICRFLERTDKRRIILNISFVLSGFNHASNFLIYIFASPRFRLVLYEIQPIKTFQTIKKSVLWWLSSAITSAASADSVTKDGQQQQQQHQSHRPFLPQDLPLQECRLLCVYNQGKPSSGSPCSDHVGGGALNDVMTVSRERSTQLTNQANGVIYSQEEEGEELVPLRQLPSSPDSDENIQVDV